jgi:hypothetical protein
MRWSASCQTAFPAFISDEKLASTSFSFYPKVHKALDILDKGDYNRNINGYNQLKIIIY